MSETLTDERLEVLREAYQHLVNNGDRSFNGDRISMDRENLSMVKELQFFRSIRCSDDTLDFYTIPKIVENMAGDTPQPNNQPKKE